MWRYLPKILLNTGVALVGGAIFYSLWLGVFLFAGQWEIPLLERILWFLAPVVTAVGFAGAVVVLDSLRAPEGVRFRSVFPWALTGCAAGALAVVWAGPMLIVFGMLGAGMLAMGLREVVHFSRHA